jgi:DNA-binding response OmpR family regulator
MPDVPELERGGSVLVIDDHAELRTMFRVALSIAGFHVLEAASPLEGRRRIVQQRPDAVVIDLQLTETEGFDLLYALRARRELDRVPIVFLAGDQSEYIRARALEAGVSGSFRMKSAT